MISGIKNRYYEVWIPIEKKIAPYEVIVLLLTAPKLAKSASAFSGVTFVSFQAYFPGERRCYESLWHALCQKFFAGTSSPR